MRTPLLWTGVFILVACGSSGQEGVPPTPAALRLALPLVLPEDPTLPDVARPLDSVLDDFVSEHGAVTTETPWAPGAYDAHLLGAFGGDAPPDLALCPLPLLRDLWDAGHVARLDALLAAHPELLQGLDAEVLDAWSPDGALAGLPLGRSGAQLLWGWVVLRDALADARAPRVEALVMRLGEATLRRSEPDLALDEIVVTPPVPGGPDSLGAPGRVDAVVLNLGDQPATGVHVVFEVPGTGGIGSADIDSIPPGGRAPIGVVVPTLVDGEHAVAVRVDPDDVILELNESNNVDGVPWQTGAGTGAPPPPAVAALGAPVLLDGAAWRTSVRGAMPRVASNGTNYLVVWSRQTPLNWQGYNHRIVSAVVTAGGSIVNPSGTYVTSKVSKYDTLDVAYGGGVYLVVWSERVGKSTSTIDPDSIVAAARVSPAGALLDPTPIVIENAAGEDWHGLAHEYPCVVFDGTDFVVTYRTVEFTEPPDQITTGNALFARKVSTSGALLPGRHVLLDITSERFAFGPHAVAFREGEGLLVHTSGRSVSGALPETRVSGLLFSMPGGVPTPSPFTPFHLGVQPVYGAPYDWPAASVATKSAYLAGWTYDPVIPGPGKTMAPHLQAALVLGGPGPVAAPTHLVTLLNGKSETDLQAAFDGKNHVFTYRKVVGCHSHPAVVRLTPTGTWGPTILFLSHYSQTLTSGTDLAFGATNGLLVWAYQAAPYFQSLNWSYEVWLQRIDKSP